MLHLVGSSILLYAWMDICCERCVLSGRGLCDGLITRPEKSYRLWCVVVCDLETSWMRRPWPTAGGLTRQKRSVHYRTISVTYAVVPKIKHYLVHVLQSNIPTNILQSYVHIYIINQQDADLAVLCLLTTTIMLYMYRTPFASIIRSTINCNSSHWCLSWVGLE